MTGSAANKNTKMSTLKPYAGARKELGRATKMYHNNENERMAVSIGRGIIRDREGRGGIRGNVKSGSRGNVKSGGRVQVIDNRIKPSPTHHEKTMMEKLLLSHDCADVIFELTNGERIFAHKCVLAVASDPLKALVTGPWLENQYVKGICVVKVEHSESAIKAMLHYIYVGAIAFVASSDNSLADSYLELLDLAAQYDLPDLASSWVTMGIEMLTQETSLYGCISNIKFVRNERTADMIVPLTIAAYYHEQNYLKEACIDYIKTKGPSIVMSDAFIELKSSHPNVWTSLRDDLGVPGQRNMSLCGDLV